MDRLRRVIERNDRHSFELMGPYTNSLWHQLSVVDDCILVDNRLAVPGQMRQAVLKRIHRGHPGQEAMLDVSKYLWWPHMHKDIVNLAEECRSCTRYDKEHLDSSALTASQLKRRIEQSRDGLKIVKKGQNSRDVSPLFKQQVDSAQDRARARALKELLEANFRWNQTRRDTSANDLRRSVEETSTTNPELRKEMLYSWERGFIEYKPEDIVSQRQWSSILIRKDEGRRSGKALTKPLKGKVVSETPSAVKTAAGAIYRKSDIAKAKVVLQDKVNHRRSPTGEKPKKKHQKQSQRKSEEQEGSEDIGSDEDLLLEQRALDPVEAQRKFQDNPTVVTSKDILQGGGLNLAVKRAKVNLTWPDLYRRIQN